MFMKRIMIDIETMATSPKAAIVQIAAVEFVLETGVITSMFAADIDWLALDADFDRDVTTAQWWLDKSKEGLQLPDGAKVPLESALKGLSAFIGYTDIDEVEMWAKSPRFDCVILQNAYNFYKLPAPWKYKNERCVRTYCAALGSGDSYKPKHTAVDDCLQQIKLVRAAYKNSRYDK